MEKIEDTAMALDQAAQYRIGSEVNDLKARVAVLESHYGKQGEDLSGVKSSIARLELSVHHQIQTISLELTTLKTVMDQTIKAQFAEHEKRELESISSLQTDLAREQKKVLVAIISLLITVIGTIVWFFIQKITVIM